MQPFAFLRRVIYPDTTRQWFGVLASSIILASLVASAVWITRDTSPPIWDIAGHQARAVIFGRYTLPPHLWSWVHLPVLYPPATYSLSGIIGVLTGFPEHFPQYTLLLFAAVNGAALYGIAARLLNARRVGALAVFLFTAAPLVVHFSRIYDLDFPLTTAVTVTAYLTLRSEGFTIRRWSLWLAIAVAFGCLTKWTFLIFWLPFAVMLFVQAHVRDHRLHIERAVWKNIGLAAGIAFVLTAPWYALHFRHVLNVASLAQSNGFSVPVAHLFTWTNISYYARQITSGLTWPLALAGLIGAAVAFHRRQRKLWPVLAWLVVPYLLLTFAFYAKETRYLLPSYGAIALLAATALLAIRQRWLRWTAVALVCGVVTVSWIDTSWNVRLLPDRVYTASGLAKTYGYNRSPLYGYTFPTQYDTHVADVAARIVEAWHGAVQPKIIVVPNSIFLSFSALSYETQRLGLYADYALSGSIRSAAYEKAFAQADFIVTKTGDQGPTVFAPFLPAIEARLENPEDSLLAPFTLLQTWTGRTAETIAPTIRLYQH